MYCPKCNIAGCEGNFCPDCGTKTIFSKVPCPFCKAPNLIHSHFCEHCGKPIQECMEEAMKSMMKGGDTK